MNADQIFVGRERELDDFTAMLERKTEHWVFAIAGSGGIGKTRLLQRMVALSQARRVVHSGLIDFYYTDLQTETGLLSAIGKRLGFDHFPQLQESLEKCGTGPAKVREENLRQALDHFISGLCEFASGCPVVFFFDTFEKATGTGVASWFLEQVLPHMQGCAVLVLAGRNTFRLAEGDFEATGAPEYEDAVIPLPSTEVQLLTLTSFSFPEVHEYLREDLTRRGEGDVPLQVDPNRYADLDRPPAEVQTIWEKSEGHPVIVALAADWLAEWGIGPITDVKDLPPEQFKQAMVERVLDLSTPEDLAVLRMAHVYHRFDADLLAVSYPELKEDGFDPDQVIQRLRRFSFVKYWPEMGNCLLHDEMQRLIERYAWDKIDSTKDVRRAISADVVEYYDQALAGEPDERARWVLEAERIYHRLYSDLEQGRPEFWRATYDAWTQYKLDSVKMLLTKAAEVNGKLKDPLLDVICRVIRTWVEVAEGNLDEARELARSVLDDPAGAQRTRASVVHALGVCADRKGDADLAVERYQEALEIYRDLEARLMRGEVPEAEHGLPRLTEVRAEIPTLLNHIGILHRRKGLLEDAAAYYEEARKVARRHGNLEMLADALNNRGNVERLRGNLPLARNMCEQALRYREHLHREQGGVSYLRDIGLSHSTLGLVRRDMGEYSRAQEHFERAEEIFEDLRYGLGLVWSSRNLGWVFYLRGKSTEEEMGQRRWFRQALRHYERSRRACEHFQIEVELPNLLNKIGIAQRKLGDTEAAKQSFTESLKLARSHGDNPFLANSLVRLAEMAYAVGDLEQVAAYAEELRRFQEEGFGFGLFYAEMEEVLAQVALDAAEYEEAFRHLGENYAHLARLNRWRFDRKIGDLRDFFGQLPDDQWRRRCAEQLIRFWEEKELADDYADLTAICEEYIMGRVHVA